MIVIADIIIVFVALLHIYFLVLEMFLWDRPTGLRVFGQTKEEAARSKVLASNQGLYNGFLAVGLFWGIILGADGIDIRIFFLSVLSLPAISEQSPLIKKYSLFRPFRLLLHCCYYC